MIVSMRDIDAFHVSRMWQSYGPFSSPTVTRGRRIGLINHPQSTQQSLKRTRLPSREIRIDYSKQENSSKYHNAAMPLPKNEHYHKLSIFSAFIQNAVAQSAGSRAVVTQANCWHQVRQSALIASRHQQCALQLRLVMFRLREPVR